MDATNLIAYLPFDADATEDLCGNSWEAIGTPTIVNGALYLDGQSSYLALNGGIALGGQDFTVRGKANISTATGNFSRIFQLHKALNTAANAFNLYRYSNQAAVSFDLMGTGYGSFAVTLGEVHDFEFDYQHDDGKLYLFIDGTLTYTLNTTIARTSFDYCWLGRSNYTADSYLTGTLDEFMIYDGVALHTEDFTPPTDDELFDLKMQFGHVHQSFAADVETELHNLPKGWRYHNPGTASQLEFDGVDVKGDYSKSVTGVCFRGGSTSQDCFNTPAGLKEVWIRFDIWTGTGVGADYRIGQYDSSTGKIIGVTREETFADYTPYRITGTAGTIYGTPNGISRCLLHIKSHATDGICELNVNGSTIAKSGNINGGRDLDTLIIYANNFGFCYFSNIIVSETPLMLDSGWHRDNIPAEAQITAPKLNVRLRGEDVPIPLRTKRETGSVAIRVGNANFYCPATATESLQAAVTFRLDDANHRLINSFG